MAKGREAVQKSTHAIDAYDQQFQRDTWESNQPLELLDSHCQLEENPAQA
jgi:hypothetical protein